MDQEGTFPSRRTLLTASVLAASSAAASFALQRASLPREASEARGQGRQEPNEPRGYRLSAHVSRYYETTRI